MKKVLLIAFLVLNIAWIASQNSYTKKAFAALLPSASPIVSTSNVVPSATPAASVQSLPLSMPSPSPQVELKQPGNYVLLHSQKNVYQTFNNCGPATLSMYLDYYDTDIDQQTIADVLRPYNNPQGYNDDKSTTLDELAAYSKQQGFETFVRPNGNINKLKMFLANDIPVMTISWIDEKGGFGHYRFVKGYDESKHEIITDDSIFGNGQVSSYDDFNHLWQIFNYNYLVVVHPGKVETVKAILGDDYNINQSYKNSLSRSQQEAAQDPNNVYPIFNQSIANYYLGDYQKSVSTFEQVQSRLPFRLLWYQIEPIESYYQLKNYDKVFSLSNWVFQMGDPSFSELYYLRGKSYLDQVKKEAAKIEFEKAVLYNKNYQPAKIALTNI